jgi:hypothetical protein
MKFIEPIAGTRKKHYQFTAIDDCTRIRVLRSIPATRTRPRLPSSTTSSRSCRSTSRPATPSRLVQTERARRAEPVGVVHQRLTDRDHRGDGRMPTNAVVRRDRRDTVTVAPHTPTDRVASPSGQRAAARDRRIGLAPRPRRAAPVGATPDPLAPHQADRPTRNRLVTHLHPATTMTDRPHPTARAADPIRGRLDQQPPPAIDELVRANHEPIQSDKSSRAVTTVHDHQGSPSRAVVDEAPGLVGGSMTSTRSRHAPSVQREEPEMDVQAPLEAELVDENSSARYWSVTGTPTVPT